MKPATNFFNIWVHPTFVVGHSLKKDTPAGSRVMSPEQWIMSVWYIAKSVPERYENPREMLHSQGKKELFLSVKTEIAGASEDIFPNGVPSQAFIV